MKIVIVSSKCYPYLGPRSHRATELAKEFSKRGHNVTLYSMLGNYDYNEFVNNTGINLKDLGKSKFGLKDNTGNSSNNILNKAIKKTIGKYFAFPFIEFFFKVRNVLNQENDIDLLITLASPHTIHWAIPYLKFKNFNKWVADCGDPYMKDPFNHHPFYFKYLEKKWCKKADFITIPIEEAKDGYYKEFHHKLKVIPQGFDFENVELNEYEKNRIPTFAYSGAIYLEKRDPKLFLIYLSKLNIDFKFIVYTSNFLYFEKYKEILGDKLELRSYVPREELLKELSKVDFLINIKNDSLLQSPSKLIDYFLTKRPILEITSEFLEADKFEEFLTYNYSNQIKYNNIDKYNIKNIANQFLNLTEI